MILDASAILAVLFAEPDAGALGNRLGKSAIRYTPLLFKGNDFTLTDIEPALKD